MVDYSIVRVDCPSIAFLFAHLGCFLKSAEGEYLEWVSLFMGEDCPYKFVLSSLFPLVSHSTECSKTSDASKEDHVVTLAPAHSPAKGPASPTSSLEVIASSGEEFRKKKKVGGKSFLSTFWDDADAIALKAHEVLFVDDLSPLMAKSSSKLLDLEKKVASSKPMVMSLFAKNKTLKNKVAIPTFEAKNDKELVAALEKSPQVEKDFCKLKYKQIDDLELKLQKVGATAVKEIKDSDEYSNELCKYYVEGFDLLMKWMAKHHPGLDLSGLVMGDI
nr:hypothetical protein CFP56_08777 [Quercus suber]